MCFFFICVLNFKVKKWGKLELMYSIYFAFFSDCIRKRHIEKLMIYRFSSSRVSDGFFLFIFSLLSKKAKGNFKDFNILQKLIELLHVWTKFRIHIVDLRIKSIFCFWWKHFWVLPGNSTNFKWLIVGKFSVFINNVPRRI